VAWRKVWGGKRGFKFGVVLRGGMDGGACDIWLDGVRVEKRYRDFIRCP
jgi:hypothetical protein